EYRTNLKRTSFHQAYLSWGTRRLIYQLSCSVLTSHGGDLEAVVTVCALLGSEHDAHRTVQLRHFSRIPYPRARSPKAIERSFLCRAVIVRMEPPHPDRVCLRLLYRPELDPGGRPPSRANIANPKHPESLQSRCTNHALRIKMSHLSG